MVDLSKARSGQIAHFRCGGNAKIKYYSGNVGDKFGIGFDGLTTVFFKDGAYGCSQNSPFDIIRLEDPPFDWKDVKPGMAFKITNFNDIYVYIGMSQSSNTGCAVLQNKYIGSSFQTCHTNHLIRTPDHDLVTQ